MIGPVLVKQDKPEATMNVEKRLEFITGEMCVDSTGRKLRIANIHTASVWRLRSRISERSGNKRRWRLSSFSRVLSNRRLRHKFIFRTSRYHLVMLHHTYNGVGNHYYLHSALDYSI